LVCIDGENRRQLLDKLTGSGNWLCTGRPGKLLNATNCAYGEAGPCWFTLLMIVAAPILPTAPC
jgi:hypothetical protein